jgi:hypothetical protein
MSQGGLKPEVHTTLSMVTPETAATINKSFEGVIATISRQWFG